MIDIKNLTEKDIGRRVKCTMYKGIENFGRIKTWDDNFIYINYDNNDPFWFERNISEPVYPEYITFVKEA